MRFNSQHSSRIRFGYAMAALLLSAFAVLAQTPPVETQKLTLNQPLERQIKGGETHVFQFNVKAGFYARAEVEQKNIDVVVSLFAPDGKLVVEMDGRDGSLWREAVSAMAEKDAVFQVRIRAYGTAEQTGSFIVKLAEARPTETKDRQRFEAEQHFDKGRKFYLQDQPNYDGAIKEFEAALTIWRELGADEWQGITLFNLTWAYRDASKKDVALSKMEQALPLFQKTNDRVGEAKALNGIGSCFQDLGQFQKAAEYYEKSLLIRRELKDRRGEGNTLHNLGLLFQDAREYQKSLPYFEQALTIRREIKDRTGEGFSLGGLGGSYRGSYQAEKGIFYYEQVVTVWRSLGNRQNETDALNALGHLSSETRQNERAKSYYEQALAMAKNARYRNGEAEALLGIGTVFSNLSNYEKSKEYYEQALVIYRELKEKDSIALLLRNLGNVNKVLAQYEKAAIFHEQALVIFRGIKDQYEVGNTLTNLGDVYHSLAQYEKARDYYEQSLVIRREIKDRRGEGATLNNLGSVYNSLSQYEKARGYYEQSLVIRREIRDRAGEGSTLNGLGDVYHRLAQYERAINYFQQSMVIFREIKDRRGEGRTLNHLGSVYNSLAQYEKARDYHEQSLVIRREIKDRRGEGSTLDDLGLVYRNLSQYEKAKGYFEQSVIIFREIKNRWGEGATLNNLGTVYHSLSQYEKARGYYEQSLVILREIRDRDSEGAVYWNLLLLSERLKNPKLSIFYGKQAVNVYQEIRGNIKGLDKESQQSFLGTKIFIYRRLSDILISEGRFAEAQAVLDLIKEQEYKDISRSGEIADTVPYSKTEAEAVAKIDKLATLGREQTELRKQQKEQGENFPTDTLKRLEQLNADIKIANTAFENALVALAKADTNVEARTLEIKGEKNLQSALQNLGKELNTGAVALYTVIGTEEEKDADGKLLKDKTRSKFGWMILVTPKDRKAYPIDVTNLEKNVFDFRSALSSDKYDPRPLAEKIYAAIFRQTSEKQKVTLEQDLREILGKYQDKTLMWSLDGVLRYIPMAALHDGNSYLVEKYRNVVFTKESLLWLMNQPNPKPQMLGLGVSAGNKDLNMTALPGVEKELTDVVRQPKETTGILDGTRKLNAAFKKQEILNLKDEDNQFQTVHIASHYSFNPLDQNASYLLIGDGKFTFGDMKTENNLFGTVDLLTLSACDTGVSGNGKEAEGFAYLAQSLGAKSVIASLWKVSDAGTPELMIRFYKLRSENPQMSKGEAFRRAQLSLLGAEAKIDDKTANGKRSEIIDLSGKKIKLPPFVKDEKKPFAHPHYWSSFVLIGNWR